MDKFPNWQDDASLNQEDDSIQTIRMIARLIPDLHDLTLILIDLGSNLSFHCEAWLFVKFSHKTTKLSNIDRREICTLVSARLWLLPTAIRSNQSESQILLKSPMPHKIQSVRHSSLIQKFPSNNLAVKDILLDHNRIEYSNQEAKENERVKTHTTYSLNFQNCSRCPHQLRRSSLWLRIPTWRMPQPLRSLRQTMRMLRRRRKRKRRLSLKGLESWVIDPEENDCSSWIYWHAIQLPGSTDTAASFEFIDEGHTLGNALRYIIMKKFVILHLSLVSY